MMTTRDRHRQPHYDRSFKGSSKRFQSRRRAGWGMNIYRNTHEGKVAGVAAGLADRCEVQLAYAIGFPEPVSILVDTFGTGTVASSKIEKAVRKVFGLKPAQIVSSLDLLRPIYEATSAYGHFGRTGRDLDTFTWEKTDKSDELAASI
jgi:S-adenosylmethionine synthetase